jgi:hypothetical protein
VTRHQHPQQLQQQQHKQQQQQQHSSIGVAATAAAAIATFMLCPNSRMLRRSRGLWCQSVSVSALQDTLACIPVCCDMRCACWGTRTCS